MEKNKKHTLQQFIDKFAALYPYITSALTLGVLIFALTALHALVYHDNISRVSFIFAFIFLALARIPILLRDLLIKHNKLGWIKNIVFAALLLLVAILVGIVPEKSQYFAGVCSIYFFLLGAGRVCACFERRKVFSYIYNGFLALVSLLIGLVAIGESSNAGIGNAVMLMSVIVIMVIALAETLIFAFSSMKLKGILNIMHKTYAFEIFYGLIILILASAFFFYIMEDSVKSYGDGLWFAFAVVTTIGFGDISIFDPMSRILAVILGMYGIVTVAVLTSIIVNFYNESKQPCQDQNQPLETPKEVKEEEQK